MSDFQNEISRLVSGFVTQITELARRAAIETLGSALHVAPAPTHTGPRRGRPPGSVNKVSTASTASTAPRGKKGAKRSAGDLLKLSERLHDFVGKHPGLRIEQINKEMGTTTRDLALPIRKLIADGAIHSKGAKRATIYFKGEDGGGRKRAKKN
jgi:hypothetical protein